MWIQTRTGGSQKICWDVFTFCIWISFEELLSVCFYTRSQIRVGCSIIVGTGSKTSKLCPIVVILFAIFSFCINVIVICRRSTPQIIIFGKFLTYIFCANRLSIHCQQISRCLFWKNQS